MGQIKQNLDILKTQDIYSLLLFCLYKMTDNPQYSTLSELVYVLDRKNLLRLIEYYGGTTLTIPTKEELDTLLSALQLYKDVDMDGGVFEKCVKNIPSDKDINTVLEAFTDIREILSKYKFSPREKEC